jgi:hypothetical protein
MTHALALQALGCPTPIEISVAEFNAIKSARTTLLTALSAEEKYDLVIENYAEYERELLGLTIEKMLHHDFQWQAFAADRYLVGRRLANALTVSRSYIDQIKQDVKTICGIDADEATTLNACFSVEYDRSIGYRVMEALRNYLQHGGFPIALSFPSEWDEPRARLRFGITPMLDLHDLAASTFKSTVYQELLAFADNAKPNATLWLREYIEGINRVHSLYRELVSERVKTARSEFGRAIQRARECFGSNVGALAAISCDDAGEQSEVVPVFEGISERLAILTRRNPKLPTLSRWYVSSEVLSS